MAEKRKLEDIQIEYKSTFKVRNLGDFQFFLPKLMGSGTHCLKIDGFPGTHGTHTNGATVIAPLMDATFDQK